MPAARGENSGRTLVRGAEPPPPSSQRNGCTAGDKPSPREPLVRVGPSSLTMSEGYLEKRRQDGAGMIHDRDRGPSSSDAEHGARRGSVISWTRRRQRLTSASFMICPPSRSPPRGRCLEPSGYDPGPASQRSRPGWPRGSLEVIAWADRLHATSCDSRNRTQQRKDRRTKPPGPSNRADRTGAGHSSTFRGGWPRRTRPRAMGSESSPAAAAPTIGCCPFASAGLLPERLVSAAASTFASYRPMCYRWES